MRRQESVTHAVGQTLIARYETISRLALFAEPHISQNLHLHGLVSCDFMDDHRVVENARGDMQRHLTEKFGWSRAEYPRGHDAVSKYVAKYCVKADGYYELW